MIGIYFSGTGNSRHALEVFLRNYDSGARITGGLHLKMPDNIADEKVLKRSLEKNRKYVQAAEQRAAKAAVSLKNNRPPREGPGFLCRAAGLFGQRLYFHGKTERCGDRIKIGTEKCVGCGRCVSLCPMKNLRLENRLVQAEGRCTMCCRCFNLCPGQAVTMLGKRVTAQGTIEKYL